MMPMRDTTVPAKVTAPRPLRLLARPRLFRRLDRARRDGLVWIAAPPGAGKTSLVSSYLKEKRLRSLWYQVDTGDADPATLFHYLGLAARAANPRSRRQLPVLTPEYLPGIVAFTRHFFETLSAMLRPRCVWVLDNFQELPNDSPVYELLLHGLEALGKDIDVIVCSRAEPPPPLARLRIHRRISIIDGADLSMTRAEATGVARLRRIRLPEAGIDRLLAETRGWAAGLTLLMEDRTDGPSVQQRPPARIGQLLFDYFAREIFAQMDSGVRQILLATAFLPEVTAATAQRLTGSPHAPTVLADLARRNYFTVVHSGGQTYQYHPLFRTFLLAQARNLLAHEEFSSIRAAATKVLEESGEIEAAAALLVEAQDWEALGPLCVRAAASLLAQGRGQTLVSWIMMLPEAMREQSPWLLYWLATVQQPLDPARSHFAKAFNLFRAQEEVLGQFLSWAGIAHCYLLLWDEFASCDHWLLAFEDLRRRHPDFPSIEIERRVVSGLVALLVFRRPQHAAIGAWAGRLSALIEGTDHPEERIRSATPLLTYYLWIGDLSNAGLLIDMLYRASHSRGAANTERMVYMLLEAAYLWHVGEFARCLSVVGDALALGDSTGLHIFDGRIRAQALYAHLGLGDIPQSAPILSAVEAQVDPGRRLDTSHYHYQAACFHLLDGNLARAESHGRKALALANEAGTVFPRGLCHVSQGLVLTRLGEHASAARHIYAAQRIAYAMNSSLLLFIVSIAGAWNQLSQGDENEACRLVREAFVLGVRHHYGSPWEAWQRDMMVRLCQLAMKHGIETDYTQFLIRHNALLPQDSSIASDAWPWPVKIYSFGRLRIEIDGKSLSSGRKGSTKPMEFLRLLIARGGRAVPERRLSEILWPEADGDIAHQSFATTLHRLRRLLANEKAVLLDDSRVSLNPRLVWLDMWVFERLPQIDDPVMPGSEVNLGDAMDEMLKIYRGDFLADEEVPWVLESRERLRSRFRRQHGYLGESLERSGAWTAAIEWHRRGIEIDPLAEEMHAGLIRSHRRLRQNVEAIAAYHRCESLFMALFGRPPGQEIQKAYQDIQGSAEP